MKLIARYRDWAWRYAEENRKVPASLLLGVGLYLYVMGVESVDVGQNAFVLWTARGSAWAYLLFLFAAWLLERRKPLAH